MKTETEELIDSLARLANEKPNEECGKLAERAAVRLAELTAASAILIWKSEEVSRIANALRKHFKLAELGAAKSKLEKLL